MEWEGAEGWKWHYILNNLCQYDFESTWTAHYMGNICVRYSISLLSNSQYLIWISCTHLLPFVVISGILHRSVLGPLLFNMFINVLRNVTNYCIHVFFLLIIPIFSMIWIKKKMIVHCCYLILILYKICQLLISWNLRSPIQYLHKWLIQCI